VIPPRYITVAVAALFAISLVVLTGVVPIQASSGHWRATAWLLDLVKRRSVHLYSRNIEPPSLGSYSQVLRGAGHFESGCRPCHGSPLSPRPPVVMRMTPHPPELSSRIARWDDRELFQIVKHGIKFTAMPAWPAPQRADEIWAIVALLRALPGLTPDRYRDLAFGDTTTGDGVTAVERCVRCHGADGTGRGGVFPTLAGQRPDYLTNALAAYREGRRHSGIMQPEAAALDESARSAVVDYFSRLPRPPAAQGSSAAGGVLVLQGDPARQIPPCSQCHGPSPTDRNPAYPLLAGQSAEYLVEQLVLFSENRRGGSGFAPIMEEIAARLSAREMRAAADYYGARR
jgi:cytochrome c553